MQVHTLAAGGTAWVVADFGAGCSRYSRCTALNGIVHYYSLQYCADLRQLSAGMVLGDAWGGACARYCHAQQI